LAFIAEASEGDEAFAAPPARGVNMVLLAPRQSVLDGVANGFGPRSGIELSQGVVIVPSGTGLPWCHKHPGLRPKGNV
jgi:hypothetical protein